MFKEEPLQKNERTKIENPFLFIFQILWPYFFSNASFASTKHCTGARTKPRPITRCPASLCVMPVSIHGPMPWAATLRMSRPARSGFESLVATRRMGFDPIIIFAFSAVMARRRFMSAGSPRANAGALFFVANANCQRRDAQKQGSFLFLLPPSMMNAPNPAVSVMAESPMSPPTSYCV